MSIHKYIFYIASLSLFLASSSTFAWDHIDLQTQVCNKTPYNLHLEKTYDYQANTNNDHSISQDLLAGKCVAVDYWMQWKDSGYDNDDRLVFSVKSIDKTTDYGNFSITGFHPSEKLMGIGSHVVESDLHGLAIDGSLSATNSLRVLGKMELPWEVGLANITVAQTR